MKAKWLVTSLVSAGLALPVAAFAWHGGPGWCAGYDGPGYGPGQGYGWHHWEDGPRHHARRAPAYDRHVYHHGARTFGMNETDAQEFMRDVAAVIHIGPKSQKAWDAMQTAYVDLAKCRYDRWEAMRPNARMTEQDYLDARSAFMKHHAEAFDRFVKARADLVKVLDEHQLRELEEVMMTGSLVGTFSPDRRSAPPKAPRADKQASATDTPV